MDPVIPSDNTQNGDLNNCQVEKALSQPPDLCENDSSGTPMECNDNIDSVGPDPSPSSFDNDNNPTNENESPNPTDNDAMDIDKEDSFTSAEKEKSLSPSPTEGDNSRSNTEENGGENASPAPEESSQIEDEQSNADEAAETSNNQANGEEEGAVDAEKPYTCHLCSKSFRNRAHIIHHLRYHPTGKEMDYKCEHCSKVYKYKRNYEIHVKVHSFPYVCVRCSKGFNWKQHLVAHIKRHHAGSTRRIKCSMCPEVFGQKFAYMQHAKIHNDNDDISEYPCGKCPKVFRYKALLLDHSKLHDQNKIYSCDLCSRTCLSALSLERHKSIHTGVKQFHCEKCGKGFTSSSSYQRHWKIHLGINYKCEICLKTFTQKSTLMTHQIVHNDDRPFCCEYCYKAFASNSKLVLHLKSHSCIKTYECENCSRSFSTYYSLLLHRKIHVKSQSYNNQFILREYNKSKILNGMPFHLKEYHKFMWGSSEDLFMDLFEESNREPLKVAENSWVLNIDLEKVHNDPKTRITFVCPMCDGSFKGKSEFLYHVKGHSEVIPLQYPLQNVDVRILRTAPLATQKEGEVRIKTLIPVQPVENSHFLGDHFLSGALSLVKGSTPGPSTTAQAVKVITVPKSKPPRSYPTPMILKEEIKEEVVDHSYGA